MFNQNAKLVTIAGFSAYFLDENKLYLYNFTFPTKGDFIYIYIYIIEYEGFIVIGKQFLLTFVTCKYACLLNQIPCLEWCFKCFKTVNSPKKSSIIA